MDYGKNIIEQYINSIKNYQNKLDNIKEEIKELKAKDAKTPELFKSTIDLFTSYESEGLVEYSDSDRSKYIFHKSVDKQLLEAIKKCSENYKSPYDDLNDKIHFDILDLEALIEAYNTIGDLKKEKEKMQKSGKGNTADGQALNELLDVVYYAFYMEVTNYKKFFLKDYYRELDEIRKSITNNSDLMSSLGTMIITNRNMKAK